MHIFNVLVRLFAAMKSEFDGRSLTYWLVALLNNKTTTHMTCGNMLWGSANVSWIKLGDHSRTIRTYNRPKTGMKSGALNGRGTPQISMRSLGSMLIHTVTSG